MQNKEAQRTYRTVPEVAQLIRTSEKQVRSLVKRGELPGFKIGREYRIRDDELHNWLEDHRIGIQEEAGPKN